MTDVTRILNAIEQGNEKAADRLLPLVYEELWLVGLIQKLKAELTEAKVWLAKNYEYSQPKYDGEKFDKAFRKAMKKAREAKGQIDYDKLPKVTDFVKEPAQPGLAHAAYMHWFSHLRTVGELTERLIFNFELSDKEKTKVVVSRVRFAFKRLVSSLEGVEDEPTELVSAQRDIDQYFECLDTTQEYFNKTDGDTKAEAIKNRVPWDENDPNFIENKKAIEQAHKVGNEHEIDELKKMNYDPLKKLLRRHDCTIKYMSCKRPRPHGKVNREDWSRYLQSEIQRARDIENAVERETLKRIS